MIAIVFLAFALALPGDGWEQLGRHTGQKLTVVLEGSTEVKGRLDRVSDRDLTIGGKRFLKQQVREVYAPVKDSAWPGGLIGAAAGYGAGWALLAINISRGQDWAWSDGVELFGPIGAAAGFPIGFGIDRAWNKKQLVYRARP